ncbi:DSCAM [Cordylochernes scorpioides]|uniref:DSCAM n=1 Tax=Cordylochernes scorpioides TaxID=51811 RepID=A0ABY6KQ66_9ARAC|nr:DSCAM [Cordylochernes scorpioides]
MRLIINECGREEPLPTQHRLEVTRDGSLTIRKLRPEDSGNFTCSVHNKHGSDDVTYSLLVREPPAAESPPFQLQVSTSDPTAVLLDLPKSTEVRGYEVHFKAEGREWQQAHVLPESDGSARLDGLDCGTRYQLYAVPDGSETRLGPITIQSSTIESVHVTKIESVCVAPVAAKQEEVVSSNTTHLLLHLGAWQSGGCPLTGLTVEYRPHSHAHWSVLRADPARPLLAVADVVPDTWYVVRVTARNVVGTTTAEYDVITMTPSGGDLGSHLSAQSSFFEDTTTLVSMASSGVVLIAGIVAVVCLVLYKRRRSSRHHYRGGIYHYICIITF